MQTFNLRFLCSLVAAALAAPVSKADVPAPPTPPPTPAGYCSTIYGELNGDLQAFNLLLKVPPVWTPIAGPPTLHSANLQEADANTGPQLIGPYYLPSVLIQLQELKALGADAILVPVGFPALYEPFFGSQAAVQPYLNFYSQVAQAVKAAGLKLIVENAVLLSSDIESGWPNLTSFYSTLDWNQYMAARATQAATLAETMQPDYLILAEEPDNEATNTGQTNLNNPIDAAQMISGEITAVRASSFPGVKLGAGFGNWMSANGPSSLVAYLDAYVALPLDYLDYHIYPINDEKEGNFIDNTLLIASLAAAAGKPVAVSEAWVWKMENSEWLVLSPDDYRGRDPFSFWGPLDDYFLQTMEALAKYTNMVYLSAEGPDYFFTYQTYGGTTANGGASNCTCTTTYCDSYDIIQTEEQLATMANLTAVYSATGFSYHTDLVDPPDTTPPSTPTSLSGTAGYTGTNLLWTASTDNVGVAGYNVYRCSPRALGQSCTGVWIANTTATTFNDSGLTENTPYNYQVQAFDLVNNNSGRSNTLSLQTFKSPPTSPTTLTATPISAATIDLAWSPPQNTTGLSNYIVYGGTSNTTLVQIATVSASDTTYNDESLKPNTYYYYEVAAVESGVTSPASEMAWTSTVALPDTPGSVVATASSSTSISLTWQEATAHNGLPIAGYQIFQGTVSGQLTDIGTVTGTADTRRYLAPSTTYYYQIVAVDTAQDVSAPSTEVSATTLP